MYQYLIWHASFWYVLRGIKYPITTHPKLIRPENNSASYNMLPQRSRDPVKWKQHGVVPNPSRREFGSPVGGINQTKLNSATARRASRKQKNFQCHRYLHSLYALTSKRSSYNKQSVTRQTALSFYIYIYMCPPVRRKANRGMYVTPKCLP